MTVQPAEAVEDRAVATDAQPTRTGEPAGASTASRASEPSRAQAQAVGSSAQEIAERGLAQALAAALWEAEPGAGAPPPLPSTVPGLMADDQAYRMPTRDEIERLAMFDIPVEMSVAAKAQRAAKQKVDEPPSWVSERLDELLRLHQRQQDHVEKLYAENRTLRGGELAHALAPLLLGLTKLYDLMAKLADADGPDSSAAALRTQLLQVLDSAGSVELFAPQRGATFESARQRGVGTVATDDAALDGCVARTVRPGFVRSDGTVVRVAEVEVLRFRADSKANANDGSQTPSVTGSNDGSTSGDA